MSPRRAKKNASGVKSEQANTPSVVTTRSGSKRGVNASSPSKSVNTRSSAMSPSKRSPLKEAARNSKVVKKTPQKSPSNKVPPTKVSSGKKGENQSKGLVRSLRQRDKAAQSKKSSDASPAKRSQRFQIKSPQKAASPRRLTRKRLLPAMEKSSSPMKTRRGEENANNDVIEIPASSLKREPKENIVAAENVKSEANITGVKNAAPEMPLKPAEKCEIRNESANVNNSVALPSSSCKQNNEVERLPTCPELSGRFLRRKWFSLKTRGGFTCLRSAILSPEEIAQEVIQHTMVYTPKAHEANFFTTKLMVRLSSRLPPTRARPSCEELVELINSKQRRKKLEAQKQVKGEGTAIRVKVERRSFTDTISHVTSNPPRPEDSPPRPQIVQRNANSRMGRGPIIQARDEITKQKEKEIALRQLKNMKYWRGGQYRY